MHRQIAGKLTSPVTKWIVLVAAVVLTGILGSLGGKLADVKNNEQSSWVPSSAESTRVADQLAKEVNPNDIPTTAPRGSPRPTSQPSTSRRRRSPTSTVSTVTVC
jgi:hypothetical protein